MTRELSWFARRLDLLSGALAEPDGSGDGSPSLPGLHWAASVVLNASAIDAHRAAWWVLASLRGGLPGSGDVLACVRAVRGLGMSVDQAAARLLATALPPRRPIVGHHLSVTRVDDGVLVDVSHTARSSLQTGTQRVVRETVRHWRDLPDVTFVRWEQSCHGYELLDEEAIDRLTDPWNRSTPSRDGETVVVLPNRCTVALLENSAPGRADELTGLARFSGNRMVSLAYDTVPLTSADTVPVSESQSHLAHLSALKHFDLLVGISRSAASEFRAFMSALPSQGLVGPRVEAVPLPITPPVDDVPAPSSDPLAVEGRPTVLVVGSHEPRKNHLAVLAAARLLWDEGVDFRLRFIGGSGWMSDDFHSEAARLVADGREISIERDVSSQDVALAYQQAQFCVFPSLHEGYGLPVAEALAHGRPVITTGYGATQEIEDQGVVLVDPRDDADLAAAMSRLLTDESHRDRLREEARGVRSGSWEHYAAELWTVMMGVG